MKFMKLGSKPDSFQTDCNNIWYVATELVSDVVVTVGDVKFCLHKFPLLSKSSLLQKMVAAADENIDEIQIPDIPGGPAAFLICAKFCYGMTVTLNAHNVVAVRCAAEYLQMHEAMEKGNLIYKIDVFLKTSVFRNWRDSIIVLQTTGAFLPLSEDLNLVGQCVGLIASKACTDASKVDWSYTYSRRKLSENGVTKPQSVPRDWWVEDLCDLELGLYSRVMATIKEKQRIPGEVIGEALKAYTCKKLPGFGKGGLSEMCHDMESKLLLETIVGLLPSGKSAVSCNFLLRLLRAARFLHCNDAVRSDLIKKIGRRLDETMVSELMFPVLEGESTKHDVEIVLEIVRESVIIDREVGAELREMKDDLISDSRKIAVGKLVDGYLVEIAKDSNLPISKFIELANMVPAEARTVHDGLYHAIDLYLMEHPELSKSEKKKLCGVMDCRKISAEVCAHVVQNERLPLRMVVQVLFFEQLRAASTAAACNACSGTIEIGSGSNGSSRSALTEEIPASRPTSADDLKSLKSMVVPGRDSNDKGNGKVKSIAMPKKILGKLLSSKGQRGSRGGDSDTTGSPELAKPAETKLTPPRNARHSVS